MSLERGPVRPGGQHVRDGEHTGQGRVSLSVSSSGTPRDVLAELVPEAERLCYVSNTLRHRPQLVVEVA